MELKHYLVIVIELAGTKMTDCLDDFFGEARISGVCSVASNKTG